MFKLLAALRRLLLPVSRPGALQDVAPAAPPPLQDVAPAAPPPLAPCTATVPTPALPPHAISPAGVALIQRFEGCARQRRDGLIEAYPDPGTGGAPWTIGWGATGPGIVRGTVWTREECDARLEVDLARYAAAVSRAIGAVPTAQHQFDALVSFHYNTGAIGRATLTRLHRAGNHDAATAEFSRWVHAGGHVLKGLVRRRAEEARLYRGRPF